MRKQIVPLVPDKRKGNFSHRDDRIRGTPGYQTSRKRDKRVFLGNKREPDLEDVEVYIRGSEFAADALKDFVVPG